VKPETMVHRANQIALFFSAYPRPEAVAGVADHFKKFWEPRMRRQLEEYVAAGGANLHDLVPDAVRRLEAGDRPTA
jgi:formate dehydrogenase subunit delta